jgi:hypothetical protein
MQQFVDQALPVVVHRKARVMGVLGQVLHLIVRRQAANSLP